MNIASVTLSRKNRAASPSAPSVMPRTSINPRPFKRAARAPPLPSQATHSASVAARSSAGDGRQTRRAGANGIEISSSPLAIAPVWTRTKRCRSRECDQLTQEVWAGVVPRRRRGMEAFLIVVFNGDGAEHDVTNVKVRGQPSGRTHTHQHVGFTAAVDRRTAPESRTELCRYRRPRATCRGAAVRRTRALMARLARRAASRGGECMLRSSACGRGCQVSGARRMATTI